MRTGTRAILAGISSIVFAVTLGGSLAHAQGTGATGSLGGYGGSMSNLDSGMGMGGPVIPYAGKFGGFMPYRMGGSSLSFQSRGASSVGSTRTSFSLSPMSGGMGQGLGSGARPFSTLGSRGGMGLGGGMTGGGGLQRPLSGPGSMGVMPPNFGYPFRQPPSLVSPSSPGMGMSM